MDKPVTSTTDAARNDAEARYELDRIAWNLPRPLRTQESGAETGEDEPGDLKPAA